MNTLDALTFRELMLEAEDLQRVNRNELKIHVTSEECVQDATERHQQLLLGFDLMLFRDL
jgi:hypothetical protein